MKRLISLLLTTVLSLPVLAACQTEPRPELVEFIDTSPYSYFTEVLQKEEGEDFVILNLTDVQMMPIQWNQDLVWYQGLKYTVDELIVRVSPDLITVSGDITQDPESAEEFRLFADFIDAYGIPWAPVWGNHDYKCGNLGDFETAFQIVDEASEIFTSYEHCIFEKGPIPQGNGNYVIGIEENGKVVEAIFMVDCLDMGTCGALGSAITIPFLYGTETLPHVDWYKEVVSAITELGCNDSMIITHVPLDCYTDAINAAYKNKDATLEESYTDEPWNPGYEDSFGVFREGPTGDSFNDGFLEAIKEMNGHTKHILVGHDHINNFSIKYEGVRLTFSLKTGIGNYYAPELVGGTVMKVNSEGIYDLYHEYVDVSEFIVQ